MGLEKRRNWFFSLIGHITAFSGHALNGRQNTRQNDATRHSRGSVPQEKFYKCIKSRQLARFQSPKAYPTRSTPLMHRRPLVHLQASRALCWYL